VPVKSVEQQSLQGVLRIRTQWQTARVARINGIRSLLAAHGYVMARGARTILRRVTALLDDSASCLCQPVVVRQNRIARASRLI
jgi:hypothetical protein